MARPLSDTLARIAAGRHAGPQAHSSGTRLKSWSSPGTNPGALAAKVYVPAGLAVGAPLVVALHGCTQTAAGYDAGTGWSVLAERHGFAVLLPEQTRANNPNLCFNWFQEADIARRGGEADSIAMMVRALVAEHHLDAARVYVTGLSAGGAMTGVMLATWPELFAGGAIIGGLPYGCATSVPEAFDRMRGHGGGDDAALAAAVTRASDHGGPWPPVSIWHGTADATVSFSNMEAIGRQWRGVHRVSGAAAETNSGSGWTHRIWRAADGRAVVEDWSIARMGHGVPIDATGAAALGESGPYMLDVGLSSTAAIAVSWGLIDASNATVTPHAGSDVVEQPAASGAASALPIAGSVQRVIEDALRSAGLMR